MPFFEESPQGFGPQIVRQPTAPAAPFGTLLASELERNTSVGNLISADIALASPADPDFDPFDDIDGYEEFASAFNEVRNADESARVKARIDRQIEGDRLLAEAGLKGVAASLLSGVLDPVNLIPIAGEAKAAYTLGRAGRALEGALNVGRAGLMTSLATEGIAQATQETRSAQESALGIAATTVLSGVLGGALGAFARESIPGLTKAAEGEMDAYARELGDSVGAARVGPQTTMELETLSGALGMEKLLKFQDPLLRTTQSEALATRQIIQDLAEVPLRFKKNEEGIASPVATETLIKRWQAPLAQSITDLDDAFVKYRTGKAKSALNRPLTIGVRDLVTRRDEKLGYLQFRQEVGKALRRDDQSDIPEVAEAARSFRKKVFDPLKKEAINAGLLPEDVSVDTALSYFTRVYNTEKIVARRTEFEDILARWLADEQANAERVLTKPGIEGVRPNASETAVDGEYLLRGVMPTGNRGVSVDAGRVRGTGQGSRDYDGRILTEEENPSVAERLESTTERYAVYRGENGKPLGVVNFAVESPASKRINADRGVSVYVVPEARRKGIATELYRRLDEAGYDISRVSGRGDLTPNGAAFVTGRARKEMPNITERQQAFIRLLPGDIRQIAEQITDTLISNGPRAQYTPIPLTRGPLKERTLSIPDAMIEDFLESDVDLVSRIYTRTMAADVELAKRFGRADMQDQIRKVMDEYAVKREKAAGNEKELTRLNKAMKADIRDLEAVRDRIRGTYALPDNPQGLAVRSARVARNLNYLRLLGGVTLSAIPDVARTVMAHGVTREFRDGLAPMVRNFKQYRLASDEVKLAGTALDMVLDSRAMSMGEILDQYGGKTRFERGLTAAASSFGMATLMSPWNAALKQFAGVVSQTRSLQAAEAVAKGTADKKELTRLAQFGINQKTAAAIAEQFRKHGSKDGGVWWANTGVWEDRAAARAYQAALAKEVDRIIVTPGQDKPLWMSTELGKVIGQFRSFALSSAQRVLISGLQERDAAQLNGLVLGTGLGMLAYYLKTRDDRLSDDPAVWVKEGIDRSGTTGWFFDANNMLEKATRNNFGVSPLLGQPAAGRYANMNAMGAVLGPTFGLATDALQLTGSAASGEWTADDSKKLRRMIPYQNIFYVRKLLDSIGGP